MRRIWGHASLYTCTYSRRAFIGLYYADPSSVWAACFVLRVLFPITVGLLVVVSAVYSRSQRNQVGMWRRRMWIVYGYGVSVRSENGNCQERLTDSLTLTSTWILTTVYANRRSDRILERELSAYPLGERCTVTFWLKPARWLNKVITTVVIGPLDDHTYYAPSAFTHLGP